MLISIRKGPSPESSREPSPADLLLACHGRIRGFSAMAAALAHAAPTTAPEEIAATAAALERYHRLALPLHEADEDDSLRPRLEASPAGDDVRAALERIADEHHQIDALVAELLPRWSALAEAPARFAALAPQLAAPTAALADLWEPHLRLEEELIFPALAALPAEAQRLVAAEMRGRRGAAG